MWKSFSNISRRSNASLIFFTNLIWSFLSQHLSFVRVIVPILLNSATIEQKHCSSSLIALICLQTVQLVPCTKRYCSYLKRTLWQTWNIDTELINTGFCGEMNICSLSNHNLDLDWLIYTIAWLIRNEQMWLKKKTFPSREMTLHQFMPWCVGRNEIEPTVKKSYEG